ncbi:MAG: cytochrome c biogenesis protein ResB [Deltaproteobacteria bacterium]|nr:cytochrome c biogenesis protein ResB [Deltaproteobacteria bacterium]
MNSRQHSPIFKFFASVRLTVTILLTLAATSVIGTVIPQNQSTEAYVQTYGRNMVRLFSVLDMFDMYHSWWFQLLLVLLTLNIIVCSVDRLPTTWKIVAKPLVFKPSRFLNTTCQRQVEVSSPDQAQSLLEKVLSRSVGRVRFEQARDGYFLWSEKGRWTRLGVYVVHLSVVFLLAGGLIGSFWGFDGSANIPEGETVKAIRLSNSGKSIPLDFEIRCDKFSVSFYDSGAPSEYRSTLTILEKGTPVLTRDIIVNDPLRYKGINLFQSSYGNLPSQNLVLSFTSRATGMEYKEKIAPGQTVTIPEGLGSFTITAFNRDHLFKGHSIGDAFVGMLKSPNGDSVEVVLPVKFPSFDRMRKGDVIVAIAETETRYYTGLQVTSDPGVWVVYTGFLLMIAGCIVTFFMSHQQICIEALTDGKISSVTVRGVANKNKIDIQKKVDAIAAEIAQTENKS